MTLTSEKQKHENYNKELADCYCLHFALSKLLVQLG